MSLYWYLFSCVCTWLLACISIVAIANTQPELNNSNQEFVPKRKELYKPLVCTYGQINNVVVLFVNFQLNVCFLLLCTLVTVPVYLLKGC